MSTLTPSQLATIAIVGSDASYFKQQVPFQFPPKQGAEGPDLQSYPDSANPEDEYGFPASLTGTFSEDRAETNFNIEGPSSPSPKSVDTVDLLGWIKVDEINADDANRTGFGASIFRLAGTNEYVVALRGTDGPNLRDWKANLDYSVNVWNDPTNRGALFNSLFETKADGNTPASGIVHFVGQSLGGGLAQYAAYEFVSHLKRGDIKPGISYDKSKVTLTTFNGFGGARGLSEIFDDFDPNLLEGAQVDHYATENDLVHLLGATKINGQDVGHLSSGVGGKYLIDFHRPQDGTKTPLPDTDPQSYPSFVVAHRIETGFYRGFDIYGADFASFPRVKPANWQYLDVSGIQPVAGYFSRLVSGKDAATSNFGAGAGIALGIALGLAWGSPVGAKALGDAFIESGYKSGAYGRLTKYGLNVLNFGLFLANVAVTFASPAVLLGRVWSSFASLISMNEADKRQTEATMSRLFAPEGNVAPAVADGPGGDSEANKTARLDQAVAISTAKENPDAIDLVFTDEKERVAAHAMSDVAGLSNFDSAEIAGRLALDGDWQRAELDYFYDVQRTSAPDAKAEANLVGSLLVGFRAEGEKFGHLDAAFKVQTEASLKAFIQSDVAQEVKTMFADNGNFEQIYEQALAYEQAAKDRRFVSVYDLLRDGQLRIAESAQTAVTRVGAGNIPFETASFDPDQVIDVSLTEGGAQTLVAGLPFAAGPGGIRVHGKLEGPGANSIDVSLGDDLIALDASGEFDLFIQEGDKQVAFAVVQSRDIDAESILTFSATLFDSAGNAMQPTRVEATIALHAAIEVNGLPGTTREILGGFTEGTDDLGNHDSGIFDPTRGDILYDSTGSDHVLAGGGSDAVFATRGGDDWIELGTESDVADAGAGNDVVAGQEGADIVFGGLGDDRLFADEVVDVDAAIAAGVSASDAGAGGDFLNGNEDDDLLIGDDRQNILEGGAGDDRIVAGGGDDTIEADGDIRGLALGEAFEVTAASATDPDGSAAGTVTIAGTAMRFVVDAPGNDSVHAGAGNDYVFAGGGDDVVWGEDGADVVFGESGNDTIFGGAGDDRLSGDNGGSVLDYASHGSDFLDGGAGDDTLYGDGGSDALFGGDGNDILIGDSSNANAGDDYLAGEAGDDQLLGGMGADTLLGGEGNDVLVGDNGGTDAAGDADFMDGGAGDDTLLGQGGDDMLLGGDGIDFLQGDDGADTLDGGAGDDVLLGGAGADTLFGGDGNDSISGDSGGASDDPIGEADFIDGGEGDDTIIGQGGDDVILGGAGADTIDGGEGNDTIDGGDGDDPLLQGGAGDDSIEGGAGNDTILGGRGRDSISGGDGNDVLVGDDGVTDSLGDADFIDGGAGDDQLFGQAGNDSLRGGDGDDSLQGGDGADVLAGDAGDDGLFGGAGDDTLDGGEGNDFLDGGAGNDMLAGGEGGDAYAYDFLTGGIDHIQDTGSNTLYLHGIQASVLQLNLGSLVLSAGDPRNEIHLDNFDPNNIAAGAGIDLFVFDDGTSFSYEQLIQNYGFTIVGTPNADVLLGTNANDVIDALESDDSVIGRAGDDVINLGTGDDTADAGDGNDTVIADDGADVVHGGAGDDALDGGAGEDQLFGDAGNDRLYGGADADILSGGTGDDTYIVDDALDTIVENIGEGYDVIESSISNTIADNVEELVLTGSEALVGVGNLGNNTIRGNSGDNELYGLGGDDVLLGNDGNDLLDGGAGDDAMAGGFGDDTYIVDSESDVVSEQYDIYVREVEYDEFGNIVGYGYLDQSGGDDEVLSSVSFTLDKFTESLTLTGTDAIDGIGNVEVNVIRGNDADNDLYAYRLNGIADVYPSVTNLIQQFTNPRNAREEMLQDKANAAIFRAEVPYYVPQQIDLVAGEGDALIGGAGNDRLYGGLDDDYLEGGAGDDLLYGFAGADTMVGGAGNDTYVVSGAYAFHFSYVGGEYVDYQDDSTDTLIEEADEGIDTVYSEVDFTLPENFENLTLLADTRDFDPDVPISTQRSGHLFATFGEGNALDNVIIANDGGNELIGWEGDDTLIGGAGSDWLDGGTGADTMQGGAGNDGYYVDDAGDLVIEQADAGHDEVYTDIDYTLTDNVEDLYLIGFDYSDALNGTGNALDNWIEGNGGNNILLGLGGNDVLIGWQGDDYMDGGAGDDTYYVDSEFDVTAEAADAGHDTVYSSVNHTLGDNLEDLYLTGYDYIWGEGNALDNLIVGNDVDNGIEGFEGDDVLYGEGGWDGLYGDEGNDRLYGGSEGDWLEGGDGNDLLDGGTDGDQMYGGAGDDTYYVDNTYDLVVEAVDEGTDTVYEDVYSFTISDNVENAVMLGDFQQVDDFNGWEIQGNALDNEITGNDNDNWLDGHEGDDTIDGRARNDLIFGGEGDDTLYGGNDAIRYQQLYIDSFGNVYSYDWGGLKPLSVFEGELALNSDEMYGEDGDDSLDGGPGDDYLEGGAGNDYLYGGDDGLVADFAEDSGGGGEEGPSGGGTDYTDDGKVFLTNEDYLRGGEGDDILDGGSGSDELYGEDGNDTLYGGADGPLNSYNNDDYLDGGAGIDYMAGGTGDDTYVLDGFFYETTDIEVYDDCGDLVPGAITRVWTTDTIVENAGEGHDRVYASADYTLPDNVEDLTLEGPDALIGRGNDGDNFIGAHGTNNRLEGLGGDDTLAGGGGDDILDGGAGNDTLYGESGNDTYLFGYGYGQDTIISTGGGQDRVHLQHGIAPEDVTLLRRGNDVVISLGGDDRMVLAGWFAQPTNRVREIVFCDDPAWDEATIAALAGANLNLVDAVNDFAYAQEDAVDPANGNVLDNDAPGGSVLHVTDPRTQQGLWGTLQLGADGSYTYTVDNSDSGVQWLGVGDIDYDAFQYNAADESGGFDDALILVEIAGTNDAPVLEPGAGTVVEDANTVQRAAVGQLLTNGSFESIFDGWSLGGNVQYAGTDSLFWPYNAAYFGAVGAPTLLSQDVETVAGERYLLEFSLEGGADEGAEVSVSWNGETQLTILDSGSEYLSDYRQYQVVLEGTGDLSHLEFAFRNDPGFWHLDDVVLGVLEEYVDLAVDQLAEGVLRFTDVDYYDYHSVDVQPRDADYLGAFDIYVYGDSTYGYEGAVGWNFQVPNEDLQFLAEGETLEQVYDVTVSDYYGGSDTQSVTVTLLGVNDAPEAEDEYFYVSEDGVLTAAGNVLDNDSDVDLSDVLSVAAPGTYEGFYGTLELAADGSFTYSLHNDSEAVQSLREGDGTEDVFEYTVTDGIATATALLFVELEGVNDAPVAVDDLAEVQEDGVQVASGNVLANDSDVDEFTELLVVNPGVYAGAYGSLSLAEDGSYVYTLDNAAAQALTGGQQVQEVFAYEATDGLESSGATLTVTVNGANDAPTVQDLAAEVSEDGPPIVLTPIYGDSDATTPPVVTVGAFGNTGFELGSFAGWQLSDATLGDVLSGGAPDGSRYASLRSGAGQDAYTVLSRSLTLEAGEALTGYAEFLAGDALPYDDDGYVLVRPVGGAATLLFGASVTSVGDYGSTDWTSFAYVAPEAGNYVLEAGVRNVQDNSVDSRLNLDGLEQFQPLVGVTLNADGTIGYDPGDRFQWLAEGERATELFQVVVTDDQGAQAVATATVDILGVNDAPTMGGGVTQADVVEDNDLSAADELGAQDAFDFADVDLSDVHEVQLGTLDAGYLGTFTAVLAADSTGGGAGSVQWAFSVANGELDALGEGETLEQTYEVLVEDAFGGSDSRIVTITLVGVNDGPVALDDAAAVQEDGTLVAAGNVLANDSDADAHDVLSVATPGTRVGAYGTLQLLADGGYTYTLDNAAAQSLAEGEVVQELFAYEATDGLAAASATLAISVTGQNDAPEAIDDVALVQEDTILTASGNVLANDTDVDAGTTLAVVSPGTYAGAYGQLELQADGSYTYTLDNAGVQHLAEGQQVNEVFGYAVTDGLASDPANLVVTVVGTNDAPVTEDDAASVVEDAVLTASGNVLANDSDVDSGTTLTVANAGLYGSLELAEDGAYTYTLDNASAAVQGLRGGEVVYDPFEYLASDGLASTPGTLTISVTGANDAPLAQNDAGLAVEDGGPVTLSAAALLANDLDADFGDTRTLVAVTNSAAGAQVTLLGADVVYDLGSLFQSLKAGATALDAFGYTMVDGAGEASMAQVLMTVTGVNDAPVLAHAIADQDAQAGEAFSFAFAADTFFDVDAGDTLSYAASQADGGALPSWLTFDAANRSFSGTPPGGTGGGTGGDPDDCGCGDSGESAPEALDLLVTATDTAGASAQAAFTLNIAGGGGGGGPAIAPIYGTDHDDVLYGTSGDDVIDGRKGYDRMYGGAGDDAYFVDQSGYYADKVVEDAVAGYDTVYSTASYTLPSNVEELHLLGIADLEGRGNALANMLIGNDGDNRLYGKSGNDLLLDDAGRDVLDGGDGDDVLDGGRGNDRLIGGYGNDLFVHTLGGGHDTLSDSGGQDALRFGAGIDAAGVAVWRHNDDLVLGLPGGTESVTLEKWYSYPSKRVERVEFADGTVWGEAELRARADASAGAAGNCYSDPIPEGYSSGGGSWDDGYDGHDGEHDDDDGHGSNGLYDAIASRLKNGPDYDFTALAAYLERQGGGGYGAMTPEQIANRWVRVQTCVAALAPSGVDCGGYWGNGSYWGYGCGGGDWSGSWGYGGSTGQTGSCGGMDSFSGLDEGFQKL